LLLLTGALAVAPVTVALLGLVTVAALGPVAAVVLGPVVVAALGPVAVVVLGPVIVVLGVATVALLGVATVALLGVGTVTGFATAGGFSARVMVSMASATRGGGIILVIPTILIHPRTTATAIPTMVARTMAPRITVIGTTETVILARPPPRRSKPHSREGVTITVRLTVCWVHRLATQFDRFRPIKVYR
jgi:hypothetical protein